ncbi:VCBS repeat-containing protein [Algibacter mikhailovii]|uniref:ASPIC/UnbV domain-containing protein n=1 Tax=Algibacter mikhailovii TaxID=425498 RepID=A0A918R494_9FLAO|nr:VCBS repeat-containing protein [Algibacter mikhailovii]GGZ86118.1 hypothetical protein GCM10007028_25530 [Algibacter mikhailovii]
MKFTTLVFLFSFLTVFNCADKNSKKEVLSKELPKKTEYLFSAISKDSSNINFINTIVESEDFNYYNYVYSYVSGGVAAADFDNDGLIDLFFTSGQGQNKLYKNKGKFVFEDVSEVSGITDESGFDMGTTVADVNNDGYLDVYICRGGWTNDDAILSNLLYINNGDFTFTEKANAFGVDDTNRGIGASFFDYDNDGDLDLFLSNAPNMNPNSRKIINLKDVENNPETDLLKGSDKLYRNNGNNHFVDVSLKAGIKRDIGFGLNPQVGDLNNDGWLDVYVSNDFSIPDFAYINNKNGTFSDSRDTMFKHMSNTSMGSDMADINNDGLNDMVVLDMSPEDYIRSKTTMSMTSINKFQEMIDKGYHYQYMHNVLQLNNGNDTFSEIANLAGIAKTDWSWAVLLADFDLDGYKDIFISNGIYRDLMSRDKNNEILNILRSRRRKPTKKDFLEYTQMLPQEKAYNYFYKNNKDLTFSKAENTWGNFGATFSNGATYADLDNDGDLDLIVNNIDEAATVLKNNAIEQNKGSYLKLSFSDYYKNRNGVGTTAKLYLNNGELQSHSLINSRGYLSSTPNQIHFGIPNNTSIDSLQIQWPNGKIQNITTTPIDTLLQIKYDKRHVSNKPKLKYNKLFEELNTPYSHKEKVFNDYDIQLLLPHKLSQLGPAIAKADINKDGIDDLFIGGAHGQSGKILLGTLSGKFNIIASKIFSEDKKYEDISAVFFDADGDNDLDLYVASGSYEFREDSPLLQDRLYINNNGHFVRSKSNLPTVNSVGSVVISADYDGDGDNDLFVGSRVIPDKYPYAPKSYLLINNNGDFTDEIDNHAPELENIGMLTCAQWVDMDNDSDLDLVVAGAWTGITVFLNNNGKLSKDKTHHSLATTIGWWNTILVKDVDGDGDLDIIAGNLGLNYKFHASLEQPFHIYTKDFDNNGSEDIMLAKYYNGSEVPVRGKSCTAQQMPHLSQKFKNYNDFANAGIKDILGEGINTSLHYEANEFRSGIFINNKASGYTFMPFTNEAQIAPINSIIYEDFDHDGIKDLLMAGNNYMSEVETTRADAGTGFFLKGQQGGEFNFIPNRFSGFVADRDVRGLLLLKNHKKNYVFVSNNNDMHQFYILR